jgi:hypothetical protein
MSVDDLACTTCDKLAAAVTSVKLVAECVACCMKTERTIELFARATLVYDKNYVRMFPEVDAFLGGKAEKQFRNLSLQVLGPLITRSSLL